MINVSNAMLAHEPFHLKTPETTGENIIGEINDVHFMGMTTLVATICFDFGDETTQ